jgi:hypothetical protein
MASAIRLPDVADRLSNVHHGWRRRWSLCEKIWKKPTLWHVVPMDRAGCPPGLSRLRGRPTITGLHHSALQPVYPGAAPLSNTPKLICRSLPESFLLTLVSTPMGPWNSSPDGQIDASLGDWPNQRSSFPPFQNLQFSPPTLHDA